MRKKHICSIYCEVCEKRIEEPKDYTLKELEDAIIEITERQNYIQNCGLSAGIEAVAVSELEQQKNALKEIMHRKVDEL